MVIVPIYRKPEEMQAVLAAAQKLADSLRNLPLTAWLGYEPIVVKVDDRDQYQPGFKFNEWELKGVPIRVELGPKDLANNACVLARRDLPGKEAKEMGVPLAGAAERIVTLLQTMQKDLFDRAKKLRDTKTTEANTYDEFKKSLEASPGFIWAHWDGTRETEEQISKETAATIRCIPFQRKKEAGKCILTGKPSEGRVVFAKAY